VEGGHFVQRAIHEAKDVWTRFLRRGKYLLGSDPLTLPILLRLTPTGTSKQITENTDLVVEGFPRSGNTFMVTALENAAHHRIRIASHVHHVAQVKLACQRALPTALVVREPLDTLASYLTYGQHGRPARCIEEYISYHRELLPYLDQLVVCHFDENVSDLSAVIERINERFDLALPPFDGSPENRKRVIDEIATFHRLTHPRLQSDFVAPRPTEARRAVTERFRAELEQPRYAKLLAEARELYGYYVQKMQEQRAEYELRATRDTLRQHRSDDGAADGTKGRGHGGTTHENRGDTGSSRKADIAINGGKDSSDR
jgi:hypothetical protein